MGQSFKDTKNLIFSKKNILISLPKFTNNDSLLAGCALYMALKKILDANQMGKVDILVPEEITDIHRRLISENILKFFKKELKSANYVLNIPHENNAVEKISYRDEGDVLKFFITPSFGELFLDNIKIDQIGANYDLVILVGFSDISRLNKVYETNKLLFDHVSKLIIGKIAKGNNCTSLVIDETLSVSETVYGLLKEFDQDIQSDVSQMLLAGIINKSGGKIQNIRSRVTLNVISELFDAGASMDSLIGESMKNKTYSHLQLAQKMYANIRQDPAGILWSVIRNYEFRELQIDDADIIIDEPIQFNCYDGYKNVFVLYELPDGSVLGRIESDNKDVGKLIKECKFVETNGTGTFIVDNDVEAVENLILKKLGASCLNEFKGEEQELPNSVGNIKIDEDRTVKKQVEIIKPAMKRAEDDSRDFYDDYSSSPIVDERNGDNFGPPQIFGANNMGRQMDGY